MSVPLQNRPRRETPSGRASRPANTRLIGRSGGAHQRLPLETPAMRLSEVAARLAVSRASAYRLVRSGQLPGIQVGQTWRVLRADFDAYLDRMRAEAERRYRQVRG